MKKKTRLLWGFTALAGILALLMVVGCSDPVKPASSTTTYSITIGDDLDGGEIIPSLNRAKEKAEVTLTIKPNSGFGYVNESLLIERENKTIVEYDNPTYESQGIVKVTFRMPKGNVTVSAEFKQLPKYSLSIADTKNGYFETDPEDEQYESWLVTIFAEPDEGYKVNRSKLKVTGGDSGKEYPWEEINDDEFTFRMPGENVTISGEFIDESIPEFDIFYELVPHGTITGPARAAAGDEITIHLSPSGGYSYKSGSLRIIGDTSGDDVEPIPNGTNFKFTMPGEDVTISAEFEKIPDVEVPEIEVPVVYYDIILEVKGAPDKAAFTSNRPQNKAEENDEVILTLVINDPNYHYLGKNENEEDSFVVTGVDKNNVEYTNLTWKFTMPPRNVSAEVTVVESPADPKPRFAVTAANGLTGGTLTFEGPTKDENGAFEADVTVTITAEAAQGYRVWANTMTHKPVVTREGGETIMTTPSGQSNQWTFTMPAETVEVDYEFEEIFVTITRTTNPATGGGAIAITDAGGEPVTAVKPGATLTITATPANEEWTVDAPTANPASIIINQGEEGNVWTFTIPADFTGASIVISVKFNQKTYSVSKNITRSNPEDSASDITFTGLDAENKAAKGVTVTVKAVPGPGNESDGEPAADGITFTLHAAEKDTWTFEMPGNDVEVNMNFKAALFQPRELFIGQKGGLNSTSGYTIGTITGLTGTGWGWVQPDDTIEIVEGEGRTAGSSAIKMANPEGTRAEMAFAIKSDTPFSLDGYAALSFWAKKDGSSADHFNLIGYGNTANNTQMRLQPAGTTNLNLINNDWKRFIVPIPNSQAGVTITDLFYVKMWNGLSIYFDDIEFITSGVEFDSISIPESAPEFLTLSNVPITDIVKPAETKLVYKADDGTSAQLQAATFDGAFGITFTWNTWFGAGGLNYEITDNDGNTHTTINISNGNITGLNWGDEFKIVVSFAGKSATMDCFVTGSPKFVIETFEGAGENWFNDWFNRGYWKQNVNGLAENQAGNSGDATFIAAAVAPGGGLRGLRLTPAQNPGDPSAEPPIADAPASAGRKFGYSGANTAEDFSSYNKLSFYIRRGAELTNDSATYKFAFSNDGLFNTAGALVGVGTLFEYDFTSIIEAQNVNTWVLVEVALSGTPFGLCDMSAVTGWAIIIDRSTAITTVGNSRVDIDTIVLE